MPHSIDSIVAFTNADVSSISNDIHRDSTAISTLWLAKTAVSAENWVISGGSSLPECLTVSVILFLNEALSCKSLSALNNQLPRPK